MSTMAARGTIRAERTQRLERMVAATLANAQRVVTLRSGSRRLEIDGFRLTTATPGPLPKRAAKQGLVYELPLAQHIVELLGWAQDNGELIREGVVVAVTGFDLDDGRVWRVRGARQRRTDAAVASLSSFCDCSCEFCYEQGSRLPWKRSTLKCDEGEQRIELLSGGVAAAMPVMFGLESLNNSMALPLYRQLRTKSAEEILIVTSGTRLTESMVEELDALRPIFLQVSLNSANPTIRRKVMGDRKPETAIGGIRILQRRRLRFVVSIVAWPTIPAEDIRETIDYIDDCGASHITVHLPSFTSDFQHRFPQPERWTEVWDARVALVEQMRRRVRTPIFITPGNYANTSIAPVVEGVVVNSPAAHAGLRAGDEIISVNRVPVWTRSDTVETLSAFGQRGYPCVIELRRGLDIHDIVLKPLLDPELDAWPYKPVGHLGHPDFGVCMGADIQTAALRFLERRLAHYAGRRALLFSSPLIRPLFEQARRRFASSSPLHDLAVAAAECRFFGGNIILGDLNVGTDFIAHIEEQADNARPDVIFLPSSFLLREDKDLNGHSFRNIRRRLGIPIELVPCQKIEV